MSHLHWRGAATLLRIPLCDCCLQEGLQVILSRRRQAKNLHATPILTSAILPLRYAPGQNDRGLLFTQPQL